MFVNKSEYIYNMTIVKSGIISIINDYYEKIKQTNKNDKIYKKHTNTNILHFTVER